MDANPYLAPLPWPFVYNSYHATLGPYNLLAVHISAKHGDVGHKLLAELDRAVELGYGGATTAESRSLPLRREPSTTPWFASHLASGRHYNIQLSHGSLPTSRARIRMGHQRICVGAWHSSHLSVGFPPCYGDWVSSGPGAERRREMPVADSLWRNLLTVKIKKT